MGRKLLLHTHSGEGPLPVEGPLGGPTAAVFQPQQRRDSNVAASYKAHEVPGAAIETPRRGSSNGDQSTGSAGFPRPRPQPLRAHLHALPSMH